MKFARAELSSIVLAVLAVASVVVVLATRHAPTTAERDARAKNLLPVWREDEVRHVELKAGATELTLEKAPDGWTVRAPEPEPADAAAVQKLLGALGFATPSRLLDAGDLHAHGLDHPRATLGIDMGGQKLTLSLGESAPAPAGAAYVSFDPGNGVVRGAVVPSAVAEIFASRPDDFRQRALVTLGARELTELDLERPDGSLKLVRGPALSFRVDGKERANRDSTEPLFTALVHLTATRFLTLPAALAARGAAAPLVLTLVPRADKDPASGPAQKTVIELGGACPGAPEELVAVVKLPRARAACVSKDVLGPLSLGPESLRDTQPFSARKDEVEALTIERGGKRLSLERRGTEFLLREPSEAQVELDAGNRRLEALVRAPGEIVAGANPKELGLEPPSGLATLRVIGDDDKATEETVELGKTAPDGTLYVRRKEDGVVLALGREAARAFAVDSTLLRSQKVLDFALSALVELELSSPEHALVRRAPQGFELVTPPGFQADGELTTNAVLALGSLTALRWVADDDDKTFGLAEPTLTARARVEGGDAGTRDHVIVVGRPTPGGYFARLAGSPGVFLVERPVVERLGTLLIDRSGFMADPATLARVTLNAKGKELVFERRGGELVPKDGAVELGAAHEALAALGSLRPEAALHSGAARASEGLAAPVLTVRVDPSPGLGKPRTLRFGASDDFRGEAVRAARVDSMDATFVVSDAKLRPLLDLF